MKTYFKKNKNTQKLLFILAVFFFCINFSFANAKENDFDFEKVSKRVVLQDEGMKFEVSSVAQTVQEFLEELKITLKANDIVFPVKNEKIFSGTQIIIVRAKKIIIKEGGKTDEIYTLQRTVEQAIWEDKKIELGQDDITVPARNSLVKEGMKITVTHVLIREEMKNIDIDFKTVSNEDDKLGWRIKKVTQKGEVGIKEVKYKVVYNDGKEISRKVLESNVIKEPINEIVTQGTYVKVGKASRGDASYYASGWGALNASRSIPRGGYAKVTNIDNGKSVIVKINDYGPQSPQRIIDLDYVSFSKIADLGQGIAHNVKVEQVLN